VYRACERAGVPRVGPHRLRYTVATETQVPVPRWREVAQLLRHANQATSSIYAAADAAAVAALAQPWPQVQPRLPSPAPPGTTSPCADPSETGEPTTAPRPMRTAVHRRDSATLVIS
jgi:hypothetical protein